MFPGAVLALALGVRRVAAATPVSRPRALALFLAGVGLVALPYLVVKPDRQHEMWAGISMGLGDYDRTKGYVWNDAEGLRALREAGVDQDTPPEVTLYDRDLASPEIEGFFRERVLQGVRSDPAWFVGILARRVVATVTQDPLLVHSGRVPRPPGPKVHVPRNQGNIRFYYRLVTTADFLGLGPWRWAVPLWVFWASGGAFVAAACWGRRWGHLRAPALVTACLACAALPMPVLVTTAGAVEPQAFILVYFLAFAFSMDALFSAQRAVTGHRDSPMPEGYQYRAARSPAIPTR
jgi:hypothetical protein